MIFFSKPSITSLEENYILDSLKNSNLSGDSTYTKKVNEWFYKFLGNNKFLLTTSGTTSLELASLILDLKKDDEIIVPSYTFSSTVNAFILRGAIPIFCDVKKETMNINEDIIESLITSRTKAIYTVDYAGVPCDFDVIDKIAKKYNLKIVSDSAQSFGSTYKDKKCGTLADINSYSFHATKNYVMGEGGGIVFNNKEDFNRAEILREKGTNRQQFMEGMVDKYTWYDVGSSYLPSDILSALLLAQVERFDDIMKKRMNIWNKYNELLKPLEDKGVLTRQFIPKYCTHNAHMYFIFLENNQVRVKLIEELKKNKISSVFHYIPLHSSPMGNKFGYKDGMLPVTEEYSERLLRLPLYYDLEIENVEFIVDKVDEFFKKYA